MLDSPPLVRHCFYCNLFPATTMDHVVPKYLGSHVDRPWNKVPCCSYCNFKKSNIPLIRWFEHLENYPHRFAHEPRRLSILSRREMILAALRKRPELARYPGHIGLSPPKDNHGG
jgi:hypothetical protein